MAKLVWTEEALRWLEDIFEYIAEDNTDAAARTVEGIHDRAQALVRTLRWASASTGDPTGLPDLCQPPLIGAVRRERIVMPFYREAGGSQFARRARHANGERRMRVGGGAEISSPWIS